MTNFFDLMQNIVNALNVVVRAQDRTVRVDKQNFTEDQKAQARENIGVASESKRTYIPYVNGGTFVYKVDGKLKSGASYGTTSFIPVTGGESIVIKGFHCPINTNAGVCAYDSDFAFIGAIITDETDTGDGKTVTLGENVAYIRVTSTNTNSVAIECIDRSDTQEEAEEAPYDLGTLTANCFVSKENGAVLSKTSYFGVTDYIEVTAGQLKVENPDLSGNAGICEYDENYNFISCVLTGVTNGQYVVPLSANAKYIRATVVNNNALFMRLYPVSTTDNSELNETFNSWMVATGNQIKTPYERINALPPTVTFVDDDTMRYDAVKRFHDIFASFGKGKNLYDRSAKTDGYRLHSGTGANYADSPYSVSDYIAIEPETQYTFSRKGVAITTNLITSMCYYNSEKTFISTVSSPTSPFTTPSGSAYLRFVTSTVRMEGSDSEGYIQLEKGATATAYEEYRSGGSQNVKGCYGVITDNLDRDETLKNLLLEYEEEGFGMLFHAKWQDTYYMDNENRNIVDAERDYCKGIRRMREIGFIDYDYWVSPYGVTDAEIVSMCKRHGAKCLMSTYNNTFIRSNGLNGNGESVERYAIPRCSMGYDDSQYPNFTLAHLKEQIDECVQNNGWLIITTHVHQWADTYGTTPDDRLKELIQYALDNGCEVKTFAEAYAERNGILLMNDVS